MNKSVILKAKGEMLSESDLRICQKALESGAPAVFPTDTVYGIGCVAFRIDGVKEIYSLKGREFTKPLPILIGDSSQLSLIVEEVLPEAKKLIDVFWPGALTLVFKTAPLIYSATRGKKTVAIRIPDHGLVKQLLDSVGLPLATTSANRSGQKSAKNFSEVKKFFNGKVPVLIDGGRCRWSLESTVVDVTHYPFTVLREGAIKKETIAEVLGL